MAVRNELAGSRTRRGDTQAVNDVVQAALQQLQQVLTRDTTHAGSLLVGARELLLQQAVRVLRLLLLAQLRAVLRHFLALARQTMLSGRIVALFEHLIRTIDSFAEFTGDFRFRSYVFSHCSVFF